MRLNEAGRTVGREMYNYNTMPPSYRKYIIGEIRKKYNCSEEEAIGRLKQNATWQVTGDRGEDGGEHEIYSVGHGDEYISSLMHKQLENYDKEMDQQILLAENITEAYNHAVDMHYAQVCKDIEDINAIIGRTGGKLTKEEANRYHNIVTNFNMIQGSVTQLRKLDEENPKLAEYLTKTVMYGTEESPEWMRKVVQARIKYNDMIIKMLDTMIKENYVLLNMTKDQAMFCSEQLNSPDKDKRSTGIKQAKAAILAEVRENPRKYRKGSILDLRPLGAGVLFPSEDYKNSGLTEMTSLDRMVQDLLQYDAICLGHGGTESAGERAASKMQDAKKGEKYKRYRTLANRIDKQIEIIRKLEFDKIVKKVDPDSELGKHINSVFKEFEEARKQYDDPALDDLPAKETKAIDYRFYAALGAMQELTHNITKNENFYKSFNTDVPEDFDKANKLIKYLEKNVENANNAWYNFKEDINEYYRQAERINRKAGKKGIKGEWVIDPVRTLSGGPFTDPNELVRQLIKEGFKNILLNQCNPGHHKLAEDILKRKDVMVTYSNNTYLLENADMNELDPAWGEMIQRLDENYATMATAVRVWHPEYANMTLHECVADIDDICDPYTLNEASLNEASLKDAWSKIVELLKRGAAFIGKLFMALIKRIKSFIMKIVDFFKRIFQSLKEKRMTGKMTRKIKSCAVSAGGKAKANTFQFDDWKTIEQNFAKHNQALQAEIERKSKEVDKILKDTGVFLEKQVKSSQSTVSESCTTAQAEALFNLIML